MATRVWQGATGKFSSSADWSPIGVPTSGDVATINYGTVSAAANDLVSDLTIQLLAGGLSPTLIVSSAMIQATDQVVISSGPGSNANLNVIGVVNNAGVISLGGSNKFGTDVIGLLDSSSGPTTLTNTGIIGFTGSFASINNLGSNSNTLVNNGIISTYSPQSLTWEASVNVAITGSGIIRVSPSYVFRSSSTLSGQTIYMENANGRGGTVEFDNGGIQNTATIYNFSRSNQILLTTQSYDDTRITTANGVTTINLDSNDVVVGQVTLNGTYSPSQLTITSSFQGTRLMTSISTTVADTASTTGVYRFFDTYTGTHFFTADLGERDSVLANNNNLIEETNGFGAVVSSDPNSKPVFRFYDNVRGTHFFTASVSERDSVIASRSDLLYEPNSTFYENTVALPGTLPVYRFFDRNLGTHFYTGDQNEFNGLTTQSSATYRADFTFEGISFYAPLGSYK